MDAVREDMQVVGVRVEDTEQVEMENDDSLWPPLKRDKLNGKEDDTGNDNPGCLNSDEYP